MIRYGFRASPASRTLSAPGSAHPTSLLFEGDESRRRPHAAVSDKCCRPAQRHGGKAQAVVPLNLFYAKKICKRRWIILLNLRRDDNGFYCVSHLRCYHSGIFEDIQKKSPKAKRSLVYQ